MNIKRRQWKSGIATLAITIILLVTASLMILYATNHSVFQVKMASNQLQNSQAFEAAEAGLEFGIVYLSANAATITATASGGLINYGASDANLTNVSLANSSQFSVVYTNPTANNYTLMQITSTGTSADGTSTRIVQQQVSLAPPSLSTLTTQGSVSVNGHGGTITGSAAVTAGGSVDPSAPASGGTIVQNDAAIAAMSGSNFFTSIFGISEATMQSQSTVYNNPGSVPWSSLSGDVWINGNVSIAGNTTAGSIAHPIILVINGNYASAGNAQIFGIVYVTGSGTFSAGNGNVTGAFISQGDVSLAGNAGVTYNLSIVNQLLSSNSPLRSYAKIPGSWKDF